MRNSLHQRYQEAMMTAYQGRMTVGAISGDQEDEKSSDSLRDHLMTV